MQREQGFQLLIILSVVLLMLTGGCNSTQKLYPDAELTRDNVARIRTKFSEKSGGITRRVTVESIDGETVDSKHHKWVAVLPGTHRISVSFYKKIDPPGLNIGMKLDFFGVKRDLIEPEPSMIITSTVDQSLVVDVRAGKSYHIAVSDDIRKAELLLPGQSFYEPLTYPGRLVGSWVPKIIEER